MRNEFRVTTLSNGLRVVTLPMAGAKSVAVGTWVGVGSRHETEEKNGISHFLEHMHFKGTKSRNARQIWHTVESLGGEINAETAQEYTAYYVKVLGSHVGHGFNGIADMLRNPTFPQRGMDKERLVILEEIKQYEDDSSSHLSHHVMATCFAGQALGRPILGSPDVIRSLSRQDLCNHVQQYYTPDNMVVAAAGAVSHNRLVALARRAYGDMKPASRIVCQRPATYTGGDARIERDLQQFQIHVAFRGVGRSHADQPVYRVLAQMLGGGNSSPLFQKMRAERGLVYDVFLQNDNYEDTGVFGVSAGLSPERAAEYLDVLTKTLRTGLNRATEQTLREAKTAIITQDILSIEDGLNRAHWAATCLLNEGEIPTTAESVAQINAVTLADIRRAHAEILSSRPTLAAIGDTSRLESYDRFASRFSSPRPS